VPIGTYTVMDGTGTPVGIEEFRASSGPFGWRYVATIRTNDPEPHVESVDLTADRRHRPVRLHIDSGSHRLLLSPQRDRLVGTLDGGSVEIPWDEGMHLDYLSPCFNALTAAALGDTADIEVVYLRPITLEPSLERQRYESLGRGEVRTPVGTFHSDAWRYTMLATGWSRTIRVTDLLVVSYEGLFELTAYDPGRTGPRPL
jgi:hypothetical protein